LEKLIDYGDIRDINSQYFDLLRIVHESQDHLHEDHDTVKKVLSSLYIEICNLRELAEFKYKNTEYSLQLAKTETNEIISKYEETLKDVLKGTKKAELKKCPNCWEMRPKKSFRLGKCDKYNCQPVRKYVPFDID